MPQRTVGRFLLDSGVTKTASFSQGATVRRELDRFTEMVITLKVTACARAGAETYDFYVTTSDGYGSWDLVHFTQIASAGAQTYTARITSQNQIPTNVSGANPGISANEPSILRNDTAGANQGIKTLASGFVRHAPWGEMIGYELVVAGGGSPSISYSLAVAVR